MRKDPTEFRKRFAAWKNGKQPYKDGKPVNVGGYEVYPSAIGASELNVTTPEIVVTGKDRRPLYQRYDAYNSTYDPNLIRNFTDWLPVVGDIGTGIDIKNAVQNKNYLEASLLGGSLLLPNILKRPIKRIGKILPHGTQARLIETFPNFFNSEKTTISSLPEEIRNKLYDFYNKDVYPRYTQIQDFNRILRPDEQYILGRGSYINDMPIIFIDGFDSKLGGWGGTKDGIFINRKYINASNNPNEKLFSTILHESEHQLRRDISKKFINPYTHFEESSLDKAYNFTDDYVKKNKMTHFTHEKGATNRQLRGKLYYDTGLTGSDLDKYIDNMADKELEDLFTHVNSSYTKNFLKNGINSTNVKRTMKWVPLISIPIIGTAFNNANYAE